MATGDIIEVAVWDSSGNPKTDALANGLVFVDYRNRSGTARTQPTFVHVGQGVYRAKPTTGDVAEGIAWVVSTGTGGFPAYWSGAVCTEAAPFAVFLLTNQSTGALWAGSAPSGLGLYVDVDGNARSAPALSAVHAPYLYAATPTAADLLVGVLGKLSMPAGADPSPVPPFSFVTPTAVAPAASGSAAEPSGLFQGTISYAAVTSRDQYAKPTTGTISTSRARIQSTRVSIQDAAGQTVQANFVIYVPPTLALTLQHRIWLTSEGDNTGNVLASRRILQIDKMRDGVGAARFWKVYV